MERIFALIANLVFGIFRDEDHSSVAEILFGDNLNVVKAIPWTEKLRMISKLNTEKPRNPMCAERLELTNGVVAVLIPDVAPGSTVVHGKALFTSTFSQPHLLNGDPLVSRCIVLPITVIAISMRECGSTNCNRSTTFESLFELIFRLRTFLAFIALRAAHL